MEPGDAGRAHRRPQRRAAGSNPLRERGRALRHRPRGPARRGVVPHLPKVRTSAGMGRKRVSRHLGLTVALVALLGYLAVPGTAAPASVTAQTGKPDKL